MSIVIVGGSKFTHILCLPWLYEDPYKLKSSQHEEAQITENTVNELSRGTNGFA